MSKRRRQAVLFFTYGFMTLATVLITLLCLALVLGYRFDLKDHRIEQGGLLQFGSAPASARITVDGVVAGFTTPGKMEVSAGAHSVMIQRDKYRPWQKDVSVAAGELRWLTYPLLIPSTLSAKTVRPVGTVTAARPTPSREYLALLATESPTSVTVLDVRDSAKVGEQVFSLPAPLLTTQEGQPTSLHIVEWDGSSRYLLVQYTSGTASEFIRLDRQSANGDPRNISREFNLPLSNMHFAGSNGNMLYALTGTDLRRVDTNAKSVSQPLVSGVTQYIVYGNATITYVATRDTHQVAGVYANDKAVDVRSVALGEPLWVDIGDYFHHEYMAIGTRNHLDIIRDPVVNATSPLNYKTLSLPYEMNWLDISSNGRMIMAGNGRAFLSFDLETNQQALVNSGQANSDLAPALLDDYHLVDNPSGVARVYDFDGTNTQELVKSERTLPVFLSSDAKYLYSFSQENNVVVLQATRLVLP